MLQSLSYRILIPCFNKKNVLLKDKLSEIEIVGFREGTASLNVNQYVKKVTSTYY